MKLCWLFLLALSFRLNVFGLRTPDFDHSASFNVSSNIPTSDGVSATHHRLFRRVRWDPNLAASDAAWTQAIINGFRINCLMRRTDKDAGKVLRDPRNPPSAASPIRYYSDFQYTALLRQWNWNRRNPAPHSAAVSTYWGWRSAVAAHGLSAQNNLALRVEHWNENDPAPPRTQSYLVDGRTKWATTARAAFVINRPLGVIHVQAFTNAKTLFREIWNRTPDPGELPPIYMLSDLLWAHWVRASTHRATALPIKFYGIMNITQPGARGMIMRALNYQEPLVWPGTTFSADSPSGRGLIGTVGASLAQLLFQHKADLGLQHIRAMTVFKSDNHDADFDAPLWPELLFFIEDIPAHLLIPQEADDWQPGTGTGPTAAEAHDKATNETLRIYERDKNDRYFRTHML